MAKKKNVRFEHTSPTQIIFGAFIKAHRVIQNKFDDEFLVKLSAINLIYACEKDKCLFYTFKDVCYFVPISEEELRKAINSFIFEPETHWESYGS